MNEQNSPKKESICSCINSNACKKRKSNFRIHSYYCNQGCFFSRGAFTNYVDKMRQVGVTGNVNGMRIFPFFKGIPSQMSTRGRQVVKKVQNLVNVAKECPLLFFTQGLASFCWYSLGFGVGSFFLSIAATVSCHVSCYVPILLSFHLTMGRKHL